MSLTRFKMKTLADKLSEQEEKVEEEKPKVKREKKLKGVEPLKAKKKK